MMAGIFDVWKPKVKKTLLSVFSILLGMSRFHGLFFRVLRHLFTLTPSSLSTLTKTSRSFTTECP